MIKQNILVISLVFLFSFSYNSFADTEIKNYFQLSNYSKSFPDENINLSEENLKNEFLGYNFFENSLKGYSKNYKIISLIDRFREPLNVVTRDISIMLDNKRVSYVILKPSLMKKDNIFFNDMKSCKLDKKNYFNKRVKDYKYTKLDVYEKKHDGYIERVFIANRGLTLSIYNNPMESYVLGETFYPEELDNEFKPEIIRSLNIAIYRVEAETKLFKDEIKLKQISKILSNWAGNPNEGYKQPKRDKKNNIIEEPENDESYLKELEPSEEYLKNEAQYDSLED